MKGEKNNITRATVTFTTKDRDKNNWQELNPKDTGRDADAVLRDRPVLGEGYDKTDKHQQYQLQRP